MRPEHCTIARSQCGDCGVALEIQQSLAQDGEQERSKPGANEGYHLYVAQQHEREQEDAAEHTQQTPPLRMFLYHSMVLLTVSLVMSFVLKQWRGKDKKDHFSHSSQQKHSSQ